MKLSTVFLSIACVGSTALARERVIIDGGAKHTLSAPKTHPRNVRRAPSKVAQGAMGVYSNGQIAYDVYDTAAALEPGVLSGFVPPVTVIERFSIPDTATNCRIEFVLDNDLTTIVQPADAKISVDVLSGPVPSVGSSIPWDPVPAMGLGTMSVVKNGNPPDHISFNCAAYAGADMYLQFKVNPAGEALNLISWNDTNTGPIVHVTP